MSAIIQEPYAPFWIAVHLGLFETCEMSIYGFTVDDEPMQRVMQIIITERKKAEKKK